MLLISLCPAVTSFSNRNMRSLVLFCCIFIAAFPVFATGLQCWQTFDLTEKYQRTILYNPTSNTYNNDRDAKGNPWKWANPGDCHICSVSGCRINESLARVMFRCNANKETCDKTDWLFLDEDTLYCSKVLSGNFFCKTCKNRDKCIDKDKIDPYLPTTSTTTTTTRQPPPPPPQSPQPPPPPPPPPPPEDITTTAESGKSGVSTAVGMIVANGWMLVVLVGIGTMLGLYAGIFEGVGGGVTFAAGSF